METEEVIKLVDNIYKNILEKFNPGARQLISAGKAYLKALHGAAAASRLFNEALAKIAVNAQQGGTTDIGSALMNIVGVYKEIQDQHMNILKAFYVDLLVPLETNLEKDTKVVQFEQKKFLQQHKIRADSYSKAAATMKKQKKKKSNEKNADKEIKTIQALDEEKNKLDAFCEQSLKNAMTQERRRYGFVLERQCSLAKHWIAYHTAGKTCITNQLDNWEEISSSREFLPPNMDNMFAKKMIMEQTIDNDDDDSDRGSIISALRKTKSIDASILDMRSLGDVANHNSVKHMPRAKSEFNLTTTVVETQHWDQRPVVRGLYAYLSSGENQLSFLEGDRIALVGDRAKGWQFGENLRTQMFGWFPVAYTEMEQDDQHTNWGSASVNQSMQQPQRSQSHHHNIAGDQTPDSSIESSIIEENNPSTAKLNLYQQQHQHKPQPPQHHQPSHHVSSSQHNNEEHSPTRMFGDTIMYRQSKQFRRVSGGGAGNTMGNNGVPKPGPPPTLPAPVPTPVVPPQYTSKSHISQSQSFSSNAGLPVMEKRKSMPATTNFSKTQPTSSSSNKPKARNGVANASLHSSNDSGFANDPPPPQPEVDYSDEETITRVPIRRSNHQLNHQQNKLHSQNNNHNNNKNHEHSLNKSRIPRQPISQIDSTTNTLKSIQYHSQNSLGTPTSTTDTLTSKSTTINRNSIHNIRQTSSSGNLADENHLDFMYLTADRKGNGNIIKRTKSFWKFGKSDDDILEGMALWKHRDLVQTENEKNFEKSRDTTLKRKQSVERNNTISTNSSETLKNGHSGSRGDVSVSDMIIPPVGSKYHMTKSDIDQRIHTMQKQQKQQQQQQQYKQQQSPDDEENIYGTGNEDENIYGVERSRSAQNLNGSTNRGQVQRQSYNEMEINEKSKRINSSKENHRNVMNAEKHNNNNVNPPKRSNRNHKYNIDNNNDHMEYYDQESLMLMDDDTSFIINNGSNISHQHSGLGDRSDREESANFYDDESIDDMLVLKTVKRQDILKQYYSSGTDTERHSSSSDPYDCIVVDDHLVRRNGAENGMNGNSINPKMDFKTFRSHDPPPTHRNDDREPPQSRTSTLLPRTKLNKPSNGNRNSAEERNGPKVISKSSKQSQQVQQQDRRSNNVSNGQENNKKRSAHIEDTNKSYGPWYDLWRGDGTLQK